MKWKVTLGLLSALLILAVLGTAVYQVTIAEAKDREQSVAEQAEARLKKELKPTDVRFESVFSGKRQYVVFTMKQSGQAVRAFVPEKGTIETRPVADGIAIKTVIADHPELGDIVSAKYGFEDRAVIEIVSKTKTGYDYSYYTYQEGSFIKRLRIK